MLKQRHYSPRINRFLVTVLFHEAKARNIPMTKLTDQLLAKSLEGSESWEKSLIQENSPQYSASIR